MISLSEICQLHLKDGRAHSGSNNASVFGLKYLDIIESKLEHCKCSLLPDLD